MHVPGLENTIVNVPLDSGDLICDNSTVPEVLHKPLFLALHNVSHPGVRGSQRLVSARFVWPGLSQDCGPGPVSGVNGARFRLM